MFRSTLALFATCAIALGACAPSDGGGGSGSGGGGGSTGAGGSVGGSGDAGTTGTAGTSGAAGTTGTAGTTATGGTGGAAGRGGSTAGTGGAAGRGGTGGGGSTGGAAGRGGTGGSAGTGGAAGRGGAGGAAGRGGTGGSAGTGGMSDPNTVVGWAAQGCTIGGVSTTTGGGNATPVSVTSASTWNANVTGTTARVLNVSGTITSSSLTTIGSNKTIIGMTGATIRGHINLGGASNVIIKNLTIIGENCAGISDCQAGDDAVAINDGAHHIWIDHVSVSDGSDGNLDVTDAADCVTISWSKFHYSATRGPNYGGSEVHHFSNLVGGGDQATGDAGHLRVTWHHNWWAENVVERQPRIRFGQNHLYNNLWTSTGSNYCVGVGFNSNVLTENNVFMNVEDPINSTGYSNAASTVVSRGNVYTATRGQTADKIGSNGPFTPPYPYTLDVASSVQSAVTTGAGPH